MDIFYSLYNFGYAFWNSTFFGFVKFLLAIYTFVLLADIVLLLILRGVGANIRQGLYGADLPPALHGKVFKRWKAITARMESGSSAQRKVAILESDALVSETLKGAGLGGENMREMLDNALPMQVENKEQILWAHEVRNNIVRDETFPVDKDLAEKTINIYKEFLESWETL